MSTIKKFITKNDEQEVVEAIKRAEKNTSGEIRVHIERTSEKIDHFERAKAVFNHLKMDQTEQKNGVLIYLAIDDKNFVIIGDKGINEKVPTNFWEDTRDIMASHFKNSEFKQGLVAGIQNAGEQLKSFFPWEANDENELSDKISR